MKFESTNTSLSVKTKLTTSSFIFKNWVSCLPRIALIKFTVLIWSLSIPELFIIYPVQLGFLRKLECVICHLFILPLEIVVLRFCLPGVAASAWLRQRDHLCLDTLAGIGLGLPRARAWSWLAFVSAIPGIVERQIVTFLPLIFIHCAHTLVSHLTGRVSLIDRWRRHQL